jgi:hypothetical protein
MLYTFCVIEEHRKAEVEFRICLGFTISRVRD